MYIYLSISRQQNGTSAEEDNYNADIDGEGTVGNYWLIILYLVELENL